jgi:hypothetical protein
MSRVVIGGSRERESKKNRFRRPPAQFPRDLSGLIVFGALSALLFLQISHS